MSKVVAVIGASNDRQKFGNKAVRAFQYHGYHVVPINPRESRIEGLRAYASVLDVPMAIDVATIYLPPERAERVLDEIARKQIPKVWVNPGAESEGVIAKARALNLQLTTACSIVGIGEDPYAW